MKAIEKISPAGSAIFSLDRLYRYELRRSWNLDRPVFCYVCQNASTADHERNDMTVTKIENFTKRFGGGTSIVVNLGGRIATDPSDLFEVADAIGPENEQFVLRAIGQAAVVVAAWGGMSNRLWKIFKPMIDVVKETCDGRLKCLGKTKSGAPNHPSRIGYDRQLVSWP
jgi:hypothetical protein